jgi:HK97 family phage prohead protease
MDELNAIKFDAQLDVGKITLVKHAGESEGKWIVEGYGSTSDLDTQDNIVTKEAIAMGATSLQKYNTLLFNHDVDRPIGVIALAEAQDTNLFIKCAISKTEPKIWNQIKDGTLSKFSIRGRILDFDLLTDEITKKEVLMIKAMELYEVSLVTIPANPHAKALGWYIEKAFRDQTQAFTKEGLKEMVKEAITGLIQKDQDKLTSAIKTLEGSLESLQGEDKDTIKSIIRSLSAMVSRLYSEAPEDTKKSVEDIKGGLETVEDVKSEETEVKTEPATEIVKAAEIVDETEVKTEQIVKSVETPTLDLSALKDVIVQLQNIAKDVNSQSETVKSALSEVSKTKDEIAKMVGDLNAVVKEIPLRKAQAPAEESVAREVEVNLIKSLEENDTYQKANPGDKLKMYLDAVSQGL